MRDVSHKQNSLRIASASSIVKMKAETVQLVKEGRAPKGDPIAVARVAATMAAKNTPDFIPYCHPIPIEHVVVEFELRESEIECTVTVKTVYKTGVEVEAMAAAAIAALNLYDLLKPVDDEISIHSIQLLSKTGGKTDWEFSQAFRAAVITVSDRCSQGEMVDLSGSVLEEGMIGHGANHVLRITVPDEIEAIRESVQQNDDCNVILLTGGTGAGPRDLTPEAIIPLLGIRLSGVEEQFRSYSQERINTAMLSRCVAGILGKTLIICLPGSVGACRDALSALFPHALHILSMLEGAGHD